MAGFAGASSSQQQHLQNPNPPLPQHQHQQQRTKRVAFSEIPGKRTMYEDIQDPNSKGHRSCRCFTCCAWICISVTAFLIIIFVLGFVAVGILRSSLPHINVLKVHSSNISISESSRQKFLTMEISVKLEFENENDKMSLHYEKLRVEIKAENVRIGHTAIPGFSQRSGNETKIDVNTTTTNTRIDDANAEILKLRYRQKAMLVDLFMTGDVGFSFGGLKIKGLPFEVNCQKVNEAYIKSDDPPKCYTKLLSFRGL